MGNYENASHCKKCCRWFMPSKFCEHLVEDEAKCDDDIDMELVEFIFRMGIQYERLGGEFECSEWEATEQAVAAWKAREVE